MKKISIFCLTAFVVFLSDYAKAQTDSDLLRITRGRYERALRYNDLAEAKSALYTLASIETENDTLLANLAYLYFDARQYASTVLVCQDVLLMNPNNAGALEMSAIAYENLGLPEKAIENFERLYLVSDDDPQILYKMTFLQYDLKQYEQCMTNIDILLGKEAIKEINALYNIGDEQKEYSAEVALLNLKGMVYRDQGNTTEAKKYFEESLAKAPDFPYAKDNLDKLNNPDGGDN